MSSLLKDVFRRARGVRSQGSQSLSFQHTGIGHRVNPATGDVGPDAPRNPRGPRGRPPGPRRGRRLGGDVRTPLA